MTAYYNEIDPYAAQWLRNLIKEGLIADGEVDTRSIVDVRPGDLVAFKQCHFFAGLGGWAGALRLAGFPDDRPVWTGSCPCQPFSLAGKQKGFDDERHLWPVWRELIRERRPAKVFGEQVASASAWLRLVRGDLEAMGYAVGAIPCEAASAGADHLRDRYWFVANADNAGSQGRQLLPECADQRPAGPHGLADANGAAIRIEPGRGSGPHGASAREHRDDSEVCLADADELGEGEGRQQRSGQQRGLSGDQEALDWVIGADGKARRVKPGIRLLVDALPTSLARMRAIEVRSLEEIGQYGTASQRDADEVLRVLPEVIRAEACWQEQSTRMRFELPAPAVLLDFLLCLASARKRAANGGGIQKALDEIQRRLLRSVRAYIGNSSSSCRWEPDEQRGREPPNSLLALSLILARDAETYWQTAAAADAASNRVAKLRALGNAIDLRPAAAFIRASM